MSGSILGGDTLFSNDVPVCVAEDIMGGQQDDVGLSTLLASIHRTLAAAPRGRQRLAKLARVLASQDPTGELLSPEERGMIYTVVLWADINQNKSGLLPVQEPPDVMELMRWLNEIPPRDRPDLLAALYVLWDYKDKSPSADDDAAQRQKREDFLATLRGLYPPVTERAEALRAELRRPLSLTHWQSEHHDYWNLLFRVLMQRVTYTHNTDALRIRASGRDWWQYAIQQTLELGLQDALSLHPTLDKTRMLPTLISASATSDEPLSDEAQSPYYGDAIQALQQVLDKHALVAPAGSWWAIAKSVPEALPAVDRIAKQLADIVAGVSAEEAQKELQRFVTIVQEYREKLQQSGRGFYYLKHVIRSALAEDDTGSIAAAFALFAEATMADGGHGKVLLSLILGRPHDGQRLGNAWRRAVQRLAEHDNATVSICTRETGSLPPSKALVCNLIAPYFPPPQDNAPDAVSTTAASGSRVPSDLSLETALEPKQLSALAEVLIEIYNPTKSNGRRDEVLLPYLLAGVPRASGDSVTPLVALNHMRSILGKPSIRRFRDADMEDIRLLAALSSALMVKLHETDVSLKVVADNQIRKQVLKWLEAHGIEHLDVLIDDQIRAVNMAMTERGDASQRIFFLDGTPLWDSKHSPLLSKTAHLRAANVFAHHLPEYSEEFLRAVALATYYPGVPYAVERHLPPQIAETYPLYTPASAEEVTEFREWLGHIEPAVKQAVAYLSQKRHQAVGLPEARIGTFLKSARSHADGFVPRKAVQGTMWNDQRVPRMGNPFVVPAANYDGQISLPMLVIRYLNLRTVLTGEATDIIAFLGEASEADTHG